MKSTKGLIFMSILFLGIGILLTILYFKSQRVCYNLPKDGTPEEFGPFYWKSLHNTVERIPCSLCQTEAVSFMSFFHDLINLKLDKPLYNANNYNKWLDKISELKVKRDAKQQ